MRLRTMRDHAGTTGTMRETMRDDLMEPDGGGLGPGTSASATRWDTVLRRRHGRERPTWTHLRERTLTSCIVGGNKRPVTQRAGRSTPAG